MSTYDGILDGATNGGKIMIGIFILVRHVLNHKRIMGYIPDHRYLITNFELTYEVADHVLSVVRMIQP